MSLRKRILLTLLAFVAGFSVMYSLVGLAVSSGQWSFTMPYEHIATGIGGGLLAVMIFKDQLFGY